MIDLKAKFTKGPWDIRPLEGGKEYIRIRGTVVGGRFKVCNVVDENSHHDESNWCKKERAESIANAHLIAAAPEMYQSLNRIYEAFSRVDANSDEAKALGSLLARARGEND